jgi:spermidine/putrescine transport system permease protein
MPKPNWLFSIISGFCILILYVPSLAVAVFSVNNSRFGLAWKGFTLSWYKMLFSNQEILTATTNTLLVAVLSTIVATILGTALALGLSRRTHSAPFSRLFSLFVNLPIVVPDVIMAVALTMAFSFLRTFSSIFDMGLVTLIIGNVTFQISFVTLTVRSRLLTLDKELDLAAKDLNADFLHSFLKVTLPLLTPSILAGAMLAFTLSLDDFIISFFVHGPEQVTLPIYIYASLKRGITPEIHALSTVLLVLTIVLIVLTERFSRTISRKVKKVTP